MEALRKTIFLVDDDVTNLTIGKKALTGKYNVFTLNSGPVMLRLLENITPDLILLDVDMPEMDGYQALKEVKESEHAAHIPVIFVTAMSDEAAEINGLSLGAIDYITKPFSAPLLLKRIEAHLMVEAQKRELQSKKLELQFYNNSLTQLAEEKTKTVAELKSAILSILEEIEEYCDKMAGGKRDSVLTGLLEKIHGEFDKISDTKPDGGEA